MVASCPNPPRHLSFPPFDLCLAKSLAFGFSESGSLGVGLPLAQGQSWLRPSELVARMLHWGRTVT